MNSLISGSYFIYAVTLRICFGFVLVGAYVATHSAYADQMGVVESGVDVLIFQFTDTDSAGSASYRSMLNDANTRANYLAATGSRYINTSRLPVYTKLDTEAAWTTSVRLHLVSSNDRAALSPVFRAESENNRFEIRPIQRSARIMWKKAFP